MRIGIIGAGQLGRMLAEAGHPLGLEFRFYDRSADTPGGQVAPIVTGEFEDHEKLAAFARGCDVVTFDWENVPVASLLPIAKRIPVYPQPEFLAIAQDRLLEKTLFRDLGIPTPPFAPVDLRYDLECALERIGAPGILKTRRLGYDGKGQARIMKRAVAGAAFASLGGQSLIYESFVRFSREVSMIAARSAAGKIVYYPLSENVHASGILDETRAPARYPALERQARRHMRAILERFKYVGILAVEFFVDKGVLLANEMAPRVHNSGHWTIEGAVSSQFENHLRAIAGLPLGCTDARGHSAMVNFVGAMPSRERALAVPGLHWHDYGKREARPGRKLGHATVVAATAKQRDLLLRRARRLKG
ncbi:MAG: 5-(carboxyamino)imidazole ribonucleotide synthase [Pseudomonadota bacterium]